MNHVIGIDSGAQGAIAVFEKSQNDWVLVRIEDMPVDVVIDGKYKHTRVNDFRLLNFLSGYRGAKVFIERPEFRPIRTNDKRTGQTVLRQIGARGAAQAGENYGIVHCAVAANNMPLIEVRPGAWKKALGLSSSKDESRRLAAERFPAFAPMFARKKDDGRAEAVEIALWGLRQ